MTQNVLNEVKHCRSVFEGKHFEVALEEKIGEDASEEDTQRLIECTGMITRHKREIKKFEDRPGVKFEKVSDVNSVKLKAGVMASVPLSFCSSGGTGMVSESIGMIAATSSELDA